MPKCTSQPLTINCTFEKLMLWHVSKYLNFGVFLLYQRSPKTVKSSQWLLNNLYT